MNCINFKREIEKYITIPEFKDDTHLPVTPFRDSKVILKNRFQILGMLPSLEEVRTQDDKFKTNKIANPATKRTFMTSHKMKAKNKIKDKVKDSPKTKISKKKSKSEKKKNCKIKHDI